MTAFLLAAALLAADPAPPPAAFVLEASGAVTVEKAGKPTPLDDGDPLRPGDKVTVPAGGGLKVFFKAANVTATLDGPATAEVKAAKLETTAKVTTKVAKINAKAADGLDKEKSTLVGGMTLRPFAPDPPPALRPVVDSAVLNRSPGLEWPAVAGAKSYRVELVSGVSEKKERPVWSAETTDAKLGYPDGQRPLDRGTTYRWKVTAVLADGSTKPAATVGRFAVLDEPAATALAGLGALENGIDPTDWLLAARAYAGWRLSDDAVRVYEKLAAARPSPGVWRALAKLYRQAGQTDRAKEAEAKAGG
jgi:hypothetical protein